VRTLPVFPLMVVLSAHTQDSGQSFSCFSHPIEHH